MVEIDGEVIELSKRFFPAVSGGAFEDSRAAIMLGDGVKYVDETEVRISVMVSDEFTRW